MTEDLSSYLEPGPAIDCRNESITTVAADITAGTVAAAERASRLFYFVRDAIPYNPFTRKRDISYYAASHTLVAKEGYCVQKAVLLAALCRAAGIPARLHFADIISYVNKEKVFAYLGTNLLVYHGYNDIYVDGRWLAADATFDIETCRKQDMRPIAFNGLESAPLNTQSEENNLHFEFVNDRGAAVDVPLPELMAASLACWGPEVTAKFAEGEPDKQRFSDL